MVKGFFWVLNLCFNPDTKEPAPLHAEYIVERLKSRKILLSTEGPGHNVLKFKPPMVFNHQNAEQLIGELEHVLKRDSAAVTFVLKTMTSQKSIANRRHQHRMQYLFSSFSNRG